MPHEGEKAHSHAAANEEHVGDYESDCLEKKNIPTFIDTASYTLKNTPLSFILLILQHPTFINHHGQAYLPKSSTLPPSENVASSSKSSLIAATRQGFGERTLVLIKGIVGKSPALASNGSLQIHETRSWS